MPIIYILENKINGKFYIGQTIQPFYKRIRDHRYNKKSLIGKALKKYGEENFNKIIINDIPLEKLDETEKEYIKEYNSIFPNGYNLTEGGDGLKNPTSEIKEKIKNSKIGIARAEETKRKISITLTGIKHSKERKQIARNRSIGEKNHFYGKHHTEETKKKMSEKKINYIPWNKGIPQSLEAKEKNRIAHLRKT